MPIGIVTDVENYCIVYFYLTRSNFHFGLNDFSVFPIVVKQYGLYESVYTIDNAL